MIKNPPIALALLATAALGTCAELPPGSDFPKQASIALTHSSALAQQTAARFDAMTESSNAYQLVLKEGAGGKPQLIWRTREEGQIVEYIREPSRSQWRRFEVGLLSLLPLDREL